MHPLRLLVLDDYEGELAAAAAMERLRRMAEVTILDRPLKADDRARLQSAQVILALRERTVMDRHFFDACPALTLVLQTGGHAYHLDRAAASSRGVVVALGRRVTKPTVAVPELVFGLLLGLVRQLYPLTAAMSDGGWPEVIGGSLSGRTFGVLGYGRLGRPVARLAQAFGMTVAAWDRAGLYPSADAAGVARLGLDDLLASADVVSVHLRLSDESRGLLNRDRIGKMKPGAILINTSRGAVLDEAALADALRAGRLSGAGLDVFAEEPLSPGSPLRTLPNVLLTPHVGWKVREVLHEFVAVAADQLHAWQEGTLSPDEVLNPEALASG